MRTSRLPRIVHFHPGATVYSARDRAEMSGLARDLLTPRSFAATATIAAALVEMRVMWPPLLHRIPAWIAVKRGMPEHVFWAKVMAHPKVGPQLARRILIDASSWAANGTDIEDPLSVGGFSQREVNFIAGLLSIVDGIEAALSDVEAGLEAA